VRGREGDRGWEARDTADWKSAYRSGDDVHLIDKKALFLGLIY